MWRGTGMRPLGAASGGSPAVSPSGAPPSPCGLPPITRLPLPAPCEQTVEGRAAALLGRLRAGGRRASGGGRRGARRPAALRMVQANTSLLSSSLQAAAAQQSRPERLWRGPRACVLFIVAQPRRTSC